MAAGRDEVVGRKAELLVLQSFLDDIQNGPAVLLLDGDAGIGKTTLWREALETARGRGYRVLACQPVESEAKLSFAALGDLFGALLDEASASLPGPQARALDVALLRAEPEGAPPDYRAVSLAVLEVLRAASRDAPVVVAVDDVQWLDAPTSRVLKFALRRLEAGLVGVLATARSGGDEAAVPLGLDRLLPEGQFRRLDVGPLTVDALANLLRARLGTGFLRPTLVRLHEMSWGLTPLQDQQLAGVIMWIPSGLVYLGAACALFVRWLHQMERDAQADEARSPTEGRGPVERVVTR